MFEGRIVDAPRIGILNTRMPDGSAGFSLLILITSDFPADPAAVRVHAAAASAVCSALNRTVSCDASRRGLTDGTLDSILFPTRHRRQRGAHHRRSAARVPAAGRTFLIGPMAKLSWGTPTLIDRRNWRHPRSAASGHRDHRRRCARRCRPRRMPRSSSLQVNFVGTHRLRVRPAPVRRLALRLARARLHADRRHGGALLLEGQRQSAADRRRIPSGLHAAADESRHAGAAEHRAVRGQSGRPRRGATSR